MQRTFCYSHSAQASQRKRILVGLGLLQAATGVGCQDAHTITATFGDDIVEAPARSLDLLVLSDTDCEETGTRTYEDLTKDPRVVFARNAAFPVVDQELLSDLPSDASLTFEAVARNASGLQIGRGCKDDLQHTDGGAIHAYIVLRTLTTCETPPNSLDITLVLDTSILASVVDPSEIRFATIVDRVIDATGYPAATRWSLVTFGGDVVEPVPPSIQTDAVKRSTLALAGNANGAPQLYDGIVYAASHARARSICTHRPALLIVAGGPEAQSDAIYQEAQLSLYERAGDPTDDIYTFAIALSVDAFRDLADVIPTDTGQILEAYTAEQIASRLENAAIQLKQLVQP